MGLLPRYIWKVTAFTAFIVVAGTGYSLKNNTYLDTSNPLLAHLPHPSHHISYFANKKNVFNTIFVKRAWGWTSAVFWLLYSATPAQARTWEGIMSWVSATGVWLAFTGWFFGPSLFSRLVTLSGGECVIHLPHELGDQVPHVIAVPAEYCHVRTVVSPATHAALFTDPSIASLSNAQVIDHTWKTTPRLYRGHDVSGHTFLLMLSILLLTSHVIQTERRLRAKKAPPKDWYHLSALANWALVVLWIFMLATTAVYFHTPQEKFSGFVLGVAGYIVSQIPSYLMTSSASSRPTKAD